MRVGRGALWGTMQPPAVPSNGRIEVNRVEKGRRLLTQNGHFEFPVLSLSHSLFPLIPSSLHLP